MPQDQLLQRSAVAGHSLSDQFRIRGITTGDFSEGVEHDGSPDDRCLQLRWAEKRSDALEALNERL